jgi:hypothetical protein
MNTVNQTIAKLIILPLFGGALITGVAVGTAESAAATTKVTGWEPPPPAAQQGPSGHAILDGEVVPTAPATPARPDVILNGIRVDAEAPAPAVPVAAEAPAPVVPPATTKPAAPADNARSSKQDSSPSDRKTKDNAKSSKGDSSRK